MGDRKQPTPCPPTPTLGRPWPTSIHPELGDLARDRITGFAGVVVAKTTWLNGCRRITLQPQTLKDGAVIPTDTFDIEQIEVTERGAFAEKPNERQTNGPMPSPSRGR